MRSGNGREELISIVVPVFNESENLPALYHRLSGILDGLGIAFEILLVDDGSSDDSWVIIEGLHRQDPRAKGIRLSRNFGHQAAITSGMDYARGAAVITMDADLQHPPELIPEMVAKWRDGCDVVCTVREDTEKIGGLKKFGSRLFYRIINSLSGVPIRHNSADFRLLDRKVVLALSHMHERARFIRGMVSWVGFSQTEVPYVAGPRLAGTPKYSLGKMISLTFTAISSFSTIPLRLAFYLGLLVDLICVVLVGYAFYNRYFEAKDLSEWASIFIVMLFLNGIQMMMLGILGVYLGRVLEEVKGRPVYLTRQTVGIPSREHNESLQGVPERAQCL